MVPAAFAVGGAWRLSRQSFGRPSTTRDTPIEDWRIVSTCANCAESGTEALSIKSVWQDSRPRSAHVPVITTLRPWCASSRCDQVLDVMMKHNFQFCCEQNHILIGRAVDQSIAQTPDTILEIHLRLPLRRNAFNDTRKLPSGRSGLHSRIRHVPLFFGFPLLQDDSLCNKMDTVSSPESEEVCRVTGQQGYLAGTLRSSSYRDRC